MTLPVHFLDAWSTGRRSRNFNIPVIRMSRLRRDTGAMSTLIWLAAVYCGGTVLLHLTSIAVAVRRCRPLGRVIADPGAPGVSVVRPVCGIDNHVGETLRSTFRLDYPDYEILFCVASARDPVVPLVERLMRDFPGRARLLIGDDRVSENPKLNNIVKGWRAAKHPWIVIADSNVLMPPDYIQRLVATWRRDTGVVCAPPIGCRPDGFWAELECAFLNTYQARFQYLADTLGAGFAQGKTMLWYRAVLNQAGGIEALARELAEDAAATKVVDAQGLRVRLADAPFGQPLGYRGAGEVWNRQVRWAQLRRASFPVCYLFELLTGAPLPLLACGLVAASADIPAAGAVLALAVVWYGGEAALAHAARWHLSALSPLASLLRDLLLPVVWVNGWRRQFVWRGNTMRAGSLSPFSSAR